MYKTVIKIVNNKEMGIKMKTFCETRNRFSRTLNIQKLCALLPLSFVSALILNCSMMRGHKTLFASNFISSVHPNPGSQASPLQRQWRVTVAGRSPLRYQRKGLLANDTIFKGKFARNKSIVKKFIGT